MTYGDSARCRRLRNNSVESRCGGVVLTARGASEFDHFRISQHPNPENKGGALNNYFVTPDANATVHFQLTAAAQVDIHNIGRQND